MNIKTLLNLQIVCAACTGCGHQTWVVWPSGEDENRSGSQDFSPSGFTDPVERDRKANELWDLFPSPIPIRCRLALGSDKRKIATRLLKNEEKAIVRSNQARPGGANTGKPEDGAWRAPWKSVCSAP